MSVVSKALFRLLELAAVGVCAAIIMRSYPKYICSCYWNGLLAAVLLALLSLELREMGDVVSHKTCSSISWA
jgi:hypothetical protein